MSVALAEPAATAADPCSTDFPTEPRLGRSVQVDFEQEALDRTAKTLENSVRARHTTDRDRFEAAAYACGVNPMTGVPYYTPADFGYWWAHAELEDARPARLGPMIIGHLYRHKIVPNARLRGRVEAVQALTGLSMKTIESAMTARVADGTYAARCLGMVSPVEAGQKFFRWYMPYEQAASIARTIGMAYQDAGV